MDLSVTLFLLAFLAGEDTRTTISPFCIDLNCNGEWREDRTCRLSFFLEGLVPAAHAEEPMESIDWETSFDHEVAVDPFYFVHV